MLSTGLPSTKIGKVPLLAQRLTNHFLFELASSLHTSEPQSSIPFLYILLYIGTFSFTFQ